MSHTCVSEIIHMVFHTKEGRNTVPAEMHERLWSFLGGIARKIGFKTIAIGGTQNHLHILLSLPATMPLAKAVQLLKGGSSKWLHETTKPRFEWQQGYGAFSLSISQPSPTIRHTNPQHDHPPTRSFDKELSAFLAQPNYDDTP